MKKPKQTFDSLDELLGSATLGSAVIIDSLGPGTGKSDAMIEFAQRLPPGTRVIFIAHEGKTP